MEYEYEQRRLVILGGRKTRVGLESDFWDCLDEIAAKRGMRMDLLLADILGDLDGDSDLAATLRVFVLAHFQPGLAMTNGEQAEKTIADRHAGCTLSENRRYH